MSRHRNRKRGGQHEQQQHGNNPFTGNIGTRRDQRPRGDHNRTPLRAGGSRNYAGPPHMGNHAVTFPDEGDEFPRNRSLAPRGGRGDYGFRGARAGGRRGRGGGRERERQRDWIGDYQHPDPQQNTQMAPFQNHNNGRNGSDPYRIDATTLQECVQNVLSGKRLCIEIYFPSAQEAYERGRAEAVGSSVTEVDEEMEWQLEREITLPAPVHTEYCWDRDPGCCLTKQGAGSAGDGGVAQNQISCPQIIPNPGSYGSVRATMVPRSGLEQQQGEWRGEVQQYQGSGNENAARSLPTPPSQGSPFSFGAAAASLFGGFGGAGALSGQEMVGVREDTGWRSETMSEASEPK